MPEEQPQKVEGGLPKDPKEFISNDPLIEVKSLQERIRQLTRQDKIATAVVGAGAAVEVASAVYMVHTLSNQNASLEQGLIVGVGVAIGAAVVVAGQAVSIDQRELWRVKDRLHEMLNVQDIAYRFSEEPAIGRQGRHLRDDAEFKKGVLANDYGTGIGTGLSLDELMGQDGANEDSNNK